MEIVMVMDVKTPAANVRYVNSEAFHCSSQRLPNDTSTCRIFITNGNFGLGQTVNLKINQNKLGSQNKKFWLCYIFMTINRYVIPTYMVSMDDTK